MKEHLEIFQCPVLTGEMITASKTCFSVHMGTRCFKTELTNWTRVVFFSLETAASMAGNDAAESCQSESKQQRGGSQNQNNEVKDTKLIRRVDWDTELSDFAPGVHRQHLSHYM